MSALWQSQAAGPYIHAPATQSHVSCCLCGVSILPNAASMCVNCLQGQEDITRDIKKQIHISWCKGCQRYLQPPNHWMHAEPESRELLTFCIKRVTGLNKVKLVDAGFIWTEPHSMRLKTKLTIQKEVHGAILQQAFVVEYVVERHMCTACNRQNANPNSWIACVQLRQHVTHKRTFFYLEQLILKHGADENCVNIKNIHNGVDFYFGSRAHACKFIDFLQSVVPLRYRHDKQLVSHTIHTSEYNYKYTFSAEIAPICKDDLVCLPAKTALGLGNLGPVVLVTRVTSAITLTDPQTMRSASLEAGQYWRAPFRPLMHARQAVEFVVLDCEPVQSSHGGGYNHGGRWQLAEATVAKAADLGANDKVSITRTHLGHLLKAGDTAAGYDLSSANVADDALDRALAAGLAPPEIVLVRKSYEEKRRRRAAAGARRAWKLKRLDGVEAGEEDEGGRGARRAAAEADAAAADMERFLEELEEDPDMRSRVAVYRDAEAAAATAARAPAAAADSEDEEDDDVPGIPLEELLEDLVAMQIGEDGTQGDELLDDISGMQLG
uniref:60S ribosomal export protein NMD3 n=1 Tax=Auxenochlorella protothecoides TaxID=3075 RepID=A0A1D2A6V5_AUXPR